jgi:hypothetical protein
MMTALLSGGKAKDAETRRKLILAAARALYRRYRTVSPKAQAITLWRNAMARAEVERDWADAGGHVLYGASYKAEPNEDRGPVRLRVIPDEVSSMDDLMGDMFDPSVNDDISPSRLELERRAFEERVSRDGVCGVQAEYWNGEEWVSTDAVWGFVGDEWQESGYDLDLMRSAMDELKSVRLCPCCGRPTVTGK